MGAQIAAHLANAGVEVVLFDLPAKDGDPDALVAKAIAGLARQEPAPLATKERAAAIEAANYAGDLAKLKQCDLVIEAIAERLDWKRELYEKIAPHLRADAILASNTSGLSLAALSEAVPAGARTRFCGVHFFNPPRYMHLVELIAAPSTEPALLDAARDLPHHDARQGRGPRQGHALISSPTASAFSPCWRRCITRRRSDWVSMSSMH